MSDDLAFTRPWRRSLERSRERHAAAQRRRRRRLRGRGLALALALAMTAGGGAAIAASGSGASPAGSASPAPGVAVVQRALGVPADGVFGPQTRQAVVAFQRSHGLLVDGIVGPQTLGALGLSGAAQPPSGAAATAPGGASPAVAATAPGGAPAGALERIARCESGGDPTAVSGSGRYRGKYQFDRETWRALGGAGDPAGAPEGEQDRLAAALLAERGASSWPTCG
jgi:Transglycosylase-like domain/Putative peptidoglycan binding domain